jgi:hypothetical protein
MATCERTAFRVRFAPLGEAIGFELHRETIFFPPLLETILPAPLGEPVRFRFYF